MSHVLDRYRYSTYIIMIVIIVIIRMRRMILRGTYSVAVSLSHPLSGEELIRTTTEVNNNNNTMKNHIHIYADHGRRMQSKLSKPDTIIGRSSGASVTQKSNRTK